LVTFAQAKVTARRGMSDMPAPRSAASRRASGSKRASARVRAELLNKGKGGGLPEGCAGDAAHAAAGGKKSRCLRAKSAVALNVSRNFGKNKSAPQS